jgi:hypothetical protein
MKLQDSIFKLTKTKRITKFICDSPYFELNFPYGLRQMKLTEPYAFYHVQSNSGLTIYFYGNNVKTREVYAELLRDDYGIQVTEADFEYIFNVPDSFNKFILDSEQKYSERGLKLIKEQDILIDICLVAGSLNNKTWIIELFADWEKQIRKL